MWLKQFKPWKVSTVVGSIEVIGGHIVNGFILCVIWKLNQWMCNVVYISNFCFMSSNWGIMPGKATENICCTKGEKIVDHSTINWWLKKFCLGYKNLNDLAMLSRPKRWLKKFCLGYKNLNNLAMLSRPKRWLKKFCLGYKNLNDLAMLSRPKRWLKKFCLGYKNLNDLAMLSRPKRWLKKFCLGYKNLNDLAMLSRPKRWLKKFAWVTKTSMI